jgi:RNA polymerase sigma factor (sigma-70 family)
MPKQLPARRRGESDDSTADLVSKARSGDRSAENEIVRRNLPELKQYARGRLPVAARSGSDTEDLVQDTMIQAWKRLRTFDPSRRGGFQAYLRTSLRHRVCDEVRRSIRTPQTAPMEDTPDQGPTPHDVIAARETVASYRRALGTLRPNYRALVQAHIERDWTHEQIARMFDKPTVNAARVALGRAVARLLAAMAREPKPRPRRRAATQ